MFGLFLCAVGIVLFLESELGLPPWDVLHQGLAEQLDVSFGVANLIVSAVILLLAWALRARIGLGTLLNALLVGSFVIVLSAVDGIAALSDEGLPVRIGSASARARRLRGRLRVLHRAEHGRRPARLADARGLPAAGLRIGSARAVIEILALAVGFALGGTAGIGTLVFALGIGPSVELSFWLLERTPLANPA